MYKKIHWTSHKSQTSQIHHVTHFVVIIMKWKEEICTLICKNLVRAHAGSRGVWSPPQFSSEEDTVQVKRWSVQTSRAARVRLCGRAGRARDRVDETRARTGREHSRCPEAGRGLLVPNSPLHQRNCTGAPATNPQSHSLNSKRKTKYY